MLSHLGVSEEETINDPEFYLQNPSDIIEHYLMVEGSAGQSMEEKDHVAITSQMEESYGVVAQLEKQLCKSSATGAIEFVDDFTFRNLCELTERAERLKLECTEVLKAAK